MTMTCPNPNCRHRTKRKLRPLVISLIPSPSKSSNDNDDNSSSPNNNNGNISNSSSLPRHEQITQMFKTNPSLRHHFELPTFSPGVPQRDLRNRIKLLEHSYNAGLIADELEWNEICRALRDQHSGSGGGDICDDDDAYRIAASHCQEKKDDEDENAISSKLKNMTTFEAACRPSVPGEKHRVLDPFRYLAITTRIQHTDDDDDDDAVETEDENNDNNNKKDNKKNNNKKKKKKDWQEYQSKSLIPISPQRKGSPEDVALPYSMELWRKAKSINRDRSVLACTLAHLMAMRTLVGSKKNGSSPDLMDGGSSEDDDVGFDFILEDNVRAFVGIADSTSETGGGWSCECANRIWDTIEASKMEAPSTTCHMRYYGWLGSSPNLNWTYKNHIPRSAFCNNASGATLPLQQLDGGADDSKPREGGATAVVFPFPTNDDFELDSIDATSRGQAKTLKAEESLIEEEDEHPSSSPDSQTPQFANPGGTAVWGTFAYTISPAAHQTLMSQLQNDVGSLLWKGKRMRAYHAKPIDKVLPRIIKSVYGAESVHLPTKVAFVRGPMLGSLLHPQWEEGFCCSTELQYSLSCNLEDGSDNDGSDVWNHVWLTNEERLIVNHRQESGKWVKKGDLSQKNDTEAKKASNKSTSKSNSSPRSKRSAAISKMVPVAACIAIVSMSLLSLSALVDGFACNTPIRNRSKQQNTLVLMSNSAIPGDDMDAVEGVRKKSKLGKVPILSRTIPIEIEVPLDLPGNNNEGTKRLDVTVWEMDKPSDLIQEWWSVDESERNSRMGDPFGVVMWPGSILASKELMKQHHYSSLSSSKSAIENSTVLVLGAGTGVEAQTAALLGAKKVIATDINSLTLKLLEYGAQNDDRIGDTVVEGRYFDLFSSEPLPQCDILIAADVLYNPELANQVGRRLHEAIVRSFEEGTPPTKVIITDSQKFHGTNFLVNLSEIQELNALFKEDNWEELKWETHKLERVCGSGVLVDEDQVYDVEARKICWGW